MSGAHQPPLPYAHLHRLLAFPLMPPCRHELASGVTLTQSSTQRADKAYGQLICDSRLGVLLRVIRCCATPGLGGIPEEHVYGLGSGKKVDVLKQLLDEHSAGGAPARSVTSELVACSSSPRTRTRAHSSLHTTPSEHALARLQHKGRVLLLLN
jgi:hypothetical protein